MSEPQFTHTPVLLNEAIDALNVKSSQVYLDATVGLGGHTRAILNRGGKVIGLDQDPQAIEQASKVVPEATLVNASFSEITRVCANLGIRRLAGALFDLGVSSMQLDDESRGFSFLKEAALDMRMSPTLQVTARDLVNALGRKELIHLFQVYGDEPKAKQLAEAILAKRRIKPFETTTELAELAESVYHKRIGKLHPATKIFQALRIAVNDELNTLKDTLPQVFDLLDCGARLVVISFHEGEDRIVKHFAKKLEESGKGKQLTKKPIMPSDAEVKTNVRARSAKLRAIEKIC